MGSHRSADLITSGVVSTAVHTSFAFLVLLVLRLSGQWPIEDGAAQGSRPSPGPVRPIFELDLSSTGAPARDPEADDSVAGDRATHLDGLRRGRGGEGAPERAINMAERPTTITRESVAYSTETASQVQRVSTRAARRSYEDFRASREPMDLTFVTLRSLGEHAGLRRSRSSLEDESVPPDPEADGSVRRAPSLKSQRGGADRFGAKGKPELARPDAASGDPSLQAETVGRPSDVMDTEQADAERERSLVNASTLGGAIASAQGGTGAPGAPGIGGSSGPGSVARPIGLGGTGNGMNPRTMYMRNLESKLYPLWADAFPAWAISKGLGGTAILRVEIGEDGSVSSAQMTRSSGVEEFDANVRRAVFRGSPYGPLPPSLAPRLIVSLSFAAVNPAVRPKHAAR